MSDTAARSAFRLPLTKENFPLQNKRLRHRLAHHSQTRTTMLSHSALLFNYEGPCALHGHFGEIGTCPAGRSS
jgi:hypothetical protein